MISRTDKQRVSWIGYLTVDLSLDILMNNPNPLNPYPELLDDGQLLVLSNPSDGKSCVKYTESGQCFEVPMTFNDIELKQDQVRPVVGEPELMVKYDFIRWITLEEYWTSSLKSWFIREQTRGSADLVTAVFPQNYKVLLEEGIFSREYMRLLTSSAYTQALKGNFSAIDLISNLDCHYFIYADGIQIDNLLESYIKGNTGGEWLVRDLLGDVGLAIMSLSGSAYDLDKLGLEIYIYLVSYIEMTAFSKWYTLKSSEAASSEFPYNDPKVRKENILSIYRERYISNWRYALEPLPLEIRRIVRGYFNLGSEPELIVVD